MNIQDKKDEEVLKIINEAIDKKDDRQTNKEGCQEKRDILADLDDKKDDNINSSFKE